MRVVRTLVFVVLHFVLAVIAVPVITAISFYTIRPIFIATIPPEYWQHGALLVLPLFPAQAIVGCIMGFSVRRWTVRLGDNLIANLTFIVPLLWFLLGLHTSHGTSSVFSPTPLQRLVWSGAMDDKLIQINHTMPLVSSIAYSIGAWIQSRKRPTLDNGHDERPRKVVF